MKNSLELEINILIKQVGKIKISQGNQHYAKHQLTKSLNIYEKALVVFRQNKNYNCQVSSHFESLLYSLIGLAYLESNQLSKAEDYLCKSLQLNPHDALTLIRRANLYCQTYRLSQALEDAEKAQFSDPNGKITKEILSLIEKSISQMEQSQQKERLTNNLQDVKGYNLQAAFNADEEEQILSFSNLKKIDRSSTSVTSNKALKKVSSFPFFIEHDKQTEPSQQNVGKQACLDEVTIIRKTSIKKKSLAGSIQTLAYNNENQSNQSKSNIQGRFSGYDSSMKSIENKILRRSSVQFFEQSNIEEKQPSTASQQNLTNRKSCLRASKIQISEQNSQKVKKLSSFVQLNNIDGHMIPSSFPNIKQQSGITKEQSKQRNASQFSDSDPQEQNEHNIYGNKSKTSKAFKCIENLSWTTSHKMRQKSKNGSILKKNSIIGSEKQAKQMRETEHKKSVCFQKQSVCFHNETNQLVLQ